MQELQEQTLLATKKNGIDNEDIIKKMDEIAAEQKRLSEEQQKQGEELKRLSEGQEHMVSFLNGEYQSFLTENGFKTKKRSRYDNAK
jgi:predicted ATP-grasp superfamily ATP-dependent carboligase